MYGWQEPGNGKRIYRVKDNTPMTGFMDFIQEKDRDIVYTSFGESRINLGIHRYKGTLYASNFAGICRLKNSGGENLKDADGNELLLHVVPRFDAGITQLLNYIRLDDEFDRYLAPQTRSNRQQERDTAAADRNEIFYFFEDEKPFKADAGISYENSIVTVTVFLNMLKSLCKRPLMGKMQKHEMNLTGKVKGKIVIEKNIRSNTMRGRNDRFYCQYLKYTDNILENQILKAALKKARRFVSDYFGTYARNSSNYAGMLSYCSNALRHIDDIPCSASDCSGLKFSGCYAYYKPVIMLAQMVLQDISIESGGTASASGYAVPYAVSMEKLFEVYVRAYLKQNGVISYREKAVTGIRLEKYDEKTDVFVEEPELRNPGKYIAGPVKPDIILTDLETGRKAVFDVKYKDFTKGDSRNDRLQLLAYSMMLNAGHIGIILPAPGTDCVFDARRVNTLEDRDVKYHQMLLSMKHAGRDVAAYIKELAYGTLQ